MKRTRMCGYGVWKHLLAPLTLVLALLAGAVPVRAATPAQEGTLDPAVVAAIQGGAAYVAAAFGVGAPAPVAVTPSDEPAPEATEEPAEEPLEIVIGELIPFVTSELTLMVPDNWNVEEGDFGTMITIEDEPSGLTGEMQDFGDQFPGLLVFPIFEGQAEALVTSMSDGAELVGVERLEIEQGLPVLRIEFRNAENFDERIDGVIYLYCSGSRAFGLFLGAPGEAWAQLVETVDGVAGSMVFNESEVDVQVAGEEPLLVEDPEGEYSLTVPAGWLTTPTQDEDLRVVVSDPGVRIVGAVAFKSDLEGDDQLQALTEAIAGALSEEDAAALADELVSTLDLGQEGFEVDGTQTQIFPTEGESMGVIRIVGSTQIQDGPTMPMSLYLGVYTDSVSALIVFGTPEDVQGVESDLLGIIDSVVVTE